MSTDPNVIARPPRRLVRRAAVAGFLGTAIESYDFFLYAYLVVYTAPLFFPSEDPLLGILSALLALGSGFLSRPLGGLFFGRLGDRRGRRLALMTTIIGMGVVTTAMGSLPTYATIGAAAPVLLVLLRLLQGFSAGGELAGSTTFVSEHAHRGNHGLLSTVTPLGTSFGAVLAPGAVALTTLLLSEEVMRTWGWRVPLLLSLPLTLVCLVMRMRLEDSPEFERLVRNDRIPPAPVRELLTRHPGALAKVVVLSATVLMIGYLMATYVPLFLQEQVGFSAGAAAGLASFYALAAIGLTIGAGLVIDRVGRRNTMVIVMGSLAVLFVPVLMLAKATGGHLLVTGIGFAVLSGLGGAVGAPMYATLTAVFPARVRYTGAAFGFGLGSALGGGVGPWLAAQLSASTDNPYAGGLLASGAAVVAVVVVFTLPARGVTTDAVTGPRAAADRPASASSASS